MGHAGEQRAEGRHFLALMQGFALALNLRGRGLHLGQIAQMRGEQAPVGQAYFGDCEFGGKLGAGGAHRLDFNATAQHIGFASLQIPLHAAMMARSQRRRNQEFGHRPADDFVARIAESRLCRWIELNDRAFLVDDDHAVERGGDDRGGARVAELELGEIAREDEIAVDLIARPAIRHIEALDETRPRAFVIRQPA